MTINPIQKMLAIGASVVIIAGAIGTSVTNGADSDQMTEEELAQQVADVINDAYPGDDDAEDDTSDGDDDADVLADDIDEGDDDGETEEDMLDDGDLSDEEMAALIELLTVTTVTTNDCVSLVQESGSNTTMNIGGGHVVYNWDVGATEPVGEGARLWSDAVSVPFVATEPAAMLTELQLSHCTDPLLGSMSAHYFAGLTVGGVELVELNPWLEPFVGEAKAVVNARASEYIPLLDVDDPTEEQVEEAHEAQLEWQDVAARLNTLLERIQNLGIETRLSSSNYHLVAGGLVVGGLPAVGLNDVQEDLPALVFAVTRKDACPLLVFGYNTGDKRLEEFPTTECAPPAPPVTEAPPPPAPPVTTTPPTTGTTVPPATTTTTVPTVTTTTPPATTTTVPTRCEGDKPRWVDSNGNGRVDPGECQPPFWGGTTVPAPATTAAPAVTTTEPTTPSTVVHESTTTTPATIPASTTTPPTVTVEF